MLENLRKIVLVLAGQLQASFEYKRIWTGYLIGLVTVLKNTYLYCGYASGRSVQILEPWLMGFHTFGDITLMLIGYIFIIADAPFVNSRSVMTIYRIKRSNWFWSMSLYLVIHGCGYYLLSLAASCVYAMRMGYLKNQWSVPMQYLAEFAPENAIVNWHLAPPEAAMLEDFLPVSAGVHTFLFILMYSVILGMLLFVLNTCVNRAVGTIVAAIVHVGGDLVRNFIPQAETWSLINHCSFMWHFEYEISLFFSYCLFLLWLCLLFFIGPVLIRYADFKCSIGDSDG